MAASTSTMASLLGLTNAKPVQKPRQFPTVKPSSKWSHQPTTLIPLCCSLKDKPTDKPESAGNKTSIQKRLLGVMAAASVLMSGFPLAADATRIEYYATVAEPSCELTYVPSGLGYCDIVTGSGPEAPYNELINVHYTARFADETVFDSTYKRGRFLTMRIGVGKVIKGLDQGILGGGGVPPMQVGGKRKLRIPPELAYGSEPAGCFSGDCNIPAKATLLYDINFVNIYSGNRK